MYVSEDDKNYVLFGETKVKQSRTDDPHTKDLEVTGDSNPRYIKIKVLNYGQLPNWHLSAGEQAWLFIDEVWVK